MLRTQLLNFLGGDMYIIQEILYYLNWICYFTYDF